MGAQEKQRRRKILHNKRPCRSEARLQAERDIDCGRLISRGGRHQQVDDSKRKQEAAPGIVGIYQCEGSAGEKRASLNAWGAHVVAPVEGRGPESAVLPFRAAR